jgi:hypothetical protein
LLSGLAVNVLEKVRAPEKRSERRSGKAEAGEKAEFTRQ